jgi:hypothetical protein
MDNDKNPWDKRPDETGFAYMAFLIFRDLGTARTLKECCRLYRIRRSLKPRLTTDGTLSGWVTNFHWHQRVAAWDEFNRKESEAATRITQDEEYIEVLDEYRENILKIGRLAIKNALNSISSVARMNQMFNTTIASGQRLAPNDYDQFVTNNKISRDAMAAARDASEFVERALGIKPAIEAINAQLKKQE